MYDKMESIEETPLLKGRGSNGIPLYFQLESILRNKISSGELKSGDQIPPETELCRQYGVSRITVRKAVDVLVRENLLVAQQGKGTFVAPQKLKRQLPRLYSFSDDMVQLGLTPNSSVITFTLESAASEDRDTLKLPPDDPYVFHLVRVRRANGIPILLERAQIPRFLCQDLVNADLNEGSLYQTLREKYGLELYDAEETYEAEIVQPDDAVLLDYTQGGPVFKIQRIAYLRDGTPFELTRAIGRGDHLQFALHLQSNQTEFRRRLDVS